MMIDERLDEQLVEQLPSVPLTDERRVKNKILTRNSSVIIMLQQQQQQQQVAHQDAHQSSLGYF